MYRPKGRRAKELRRNSPRFPAKPPLFRHHSRQNDPFCRYSKSPLPYSCGFPGHRTEQTLELKDIRTQSVEDPNSNNSKQDCSGCPVLAERFLFLLQEPWPLHGRRHQEPLVCLKGIGVGGECCTLPCSTPSIGPIKDVISRCSIPFLAEGSFAC